MNSHRNSDSVGCAYVRAVGAATLTFVGWQLLTHFLHPHWFELVLMTPFLFVGVGVVIFFAALLPFLMVRWLAKTLCIRSIWYFAISGAAIGVFLLPLVILAIPVPAYDDSPSQPPFSEVFINAVPLFALSGTIGALVYWWRVGRYFGTGAARGSSGDAASAQ